MDLTDRFLLDQDWIDGLDNSLDFRELCIKSGYKLKIVYPIYYQGWELDEWGAIGAKDGKTFRLETNHGRLIPVQVSSYSLIRWFKDLKE